MNGAETFCNQKVNIERCQKNQTYVDDFCLDVLFSGFLVTRTRSVGRASFSMLTVPIPVMSIRRGSFSLRWLLSTQSFHKVKSVKIAERRSAIFPRFRCFQGAKKKGAIIEKLPLETAISPQNLEMPAQRISWDPWGYMNLI